MNTLTAIKPRGLTMRQAAAYWGVSYGTFRKLIKEGVAPPPIDMGLRRFIFDREAMDAAMETRGAFNGARCETVNAAELESLRTILTNWKGA